MKKILSLLLLTIFIAGCSNIELPQNLCDNQENSLFSKTLLTHLEPMQGEQIGELASKIFNNQNINFYILATNDKVCQDEYITLLFEISNGQIQKVSSDLSNSPTINVKTNQDILTNLLVIDNKPAVLKDALDNNLLEVSAIGLKNKIKLASSLSTIKATVKKEDIEEYKNQLRESNVEIVPRELVEQEQAESEQEETEQEQDETIEAQEELEQQLQETQIRECGTYTDNSGTGPFEYTLESDLELNRDEDGWACIQLVGRITLDCKGHTIQGYEQVGREGYFGTAISLGDRHDNGPYNIINCKIENVATGIDANNAGSLTVENAKIENADLQAINVEQTRFTIQNSYIKDSNKGLKVQFAEIANVFYTNITNNQENGIYLNAVDSARVSHNNFCNNAQEPFANRPAFDITCVNSARTFAENNAFSSSDVENCGNMQQAVLACE